MSDEDLPSVFVWGNTGLDNNAFAVVTELPSYTDLTVDSRHNEAGTWQLTVPDNAKAAAFLPDRLISFDWRDDRIMTGILTQKRKSFDENGDPTIVFSGLDAMARVGWALAWPNPALGLQQQPYHDPSAPAPISDVAETAVLRIIRENLVVRRADPVNMVGSQGRGVTVRIRPDFDNLLELALRKLKSSNLGLKVGLGPSETRPHLNISVYAPEDKSGRVVFSRDIVGSVAAWDLIESAPTCTRSLVKGAGSGIDTRYRSVVTTESYATSLTWGGQRETLSEGPVTLDNSELDEAATEIVEDGAATISASVTAAESGNLKAFRDYNVGDAAAWEDNASGVGRIDTITSIRVVVDENGPTVTPTFGDPDSDSPVLKTAQIVRETRRELGKLRKRR